MYLQPGTRETNAHKNKRKGRQGSEAVEERNTKKRKQVTGLEPEESLPNTIHTRGIVRSFRDVPPTHYCLKINSFSFLANNKIENYESRVFEVGGYKWELSLYANGNKERNVTDHISLYLGIVDTKALPPGWEVNVSFKLFAFDHIRDRYLTIQEGEIQRFNWMKTQRGFDKFLPLEIFNDATNGYLLDDCCVFGTEVFVLKNKGTGECLSLMTDKGKNTYTWTIKRFSAINKRRLYSSDFVIGDHKWKLRFCPKGCNAFKGKSVSLFLELADPNECKVYADYKLRVKNQAVGNLSERGGKHWFCASTSHWGYPKFMALSDFKNASKGFLMNDAVVIEVQIMQIFTSKDI